LVEIFVLYLYHILKQFHHWGQQGTHVNTGKKDTVVPPASDEEPLDEGIK
jgi:hypothetical protein